MPVLIVLSGLPGVGKTTIARGLACAFGAVHMRVDTIEQALRRSGAVPGGMNDAGYRVAYALAADNVRLGLPVIADCVNPWSLTRDAWKDVADATTRPGRASTSRVTPPARRRRKALRQL